MRRTLLESGARGFALRFLQMKPGRAVATALGLALSVLLLAATTVLGASLQAVLAQQGRQGFGDYDLSVRESTGLLSTGAINAFAYAVPMGIHWSVGVLMLDPGQPEAGGVSLDAQYIGVGEFREANRAYVLAQGHYPGPGEFVARAETVRRLGLQLGQTTMLHFKTGALPVRLAGIRADTLLEDGELPGALLFNLSWLQEQMNLPGEVSRRLVVVVPGASPELIAGNMNLQMKNHNLVLQQRTELDGAKQMVGFLRGFAIAFGCLAFVTALYLLAGAFDIAVHERLPQLAMLRAVGATPAQVNRLLLWETAALCVVGSVTGVLGGIGLSRLALTQAAAGLGIPPGPLVVPWVPLGLEAAAAVLLALRITRKPARAAGLLSPLAAMRPQFGQRIRLSSTEGRAGFVLMLLGMVAAPLGLLASRDSNFRLVGLFGGALFVVGLLAAMPRMLSGFVAILAVPLKALFPVETIMAARSIDRYRRRNGMTVAAIALGVALLAVIASYLYAAPVTQMKYLPREIPTDAVIQGGPLEDLGLDLAGQIAAIPGVTGVVTEGQGRLGALVGYDATRIDPTWLAEVQARSHVPDAERRITLYGADLPALARLSQQTGRASQVGQIQGDPTAGLTIPALTAQHLGLKIGDSLRFLPFDNMKRAGGNDEMLDLTVTAIVTELPTSMHAGMILPRQAAGGADHAIYFNYDPSRADGVITAVTQLLKDPRYGLATLRDFAAEERSSETGGKQLTAVLGAAVIVMAFVCLMGLVNTIWAGVQARRRELAMLRAVGATPTQLVGQVMLESALLGLTGSVMGLVGAFAFLRSIFIVDPAGFPVYPWWIYLGCLAGGPLLAMPAGALVARRIFRGTASAALRAE